MIALLIPLVSSAFSNPFSDEFNVHQWTPSTDSLYFSNVETPILFRQQSIHRRLTIRHWENGLSSLEDSSLSIVSPTLGFTGSGYRLAIQTPAVFAGTGPLFENGSLSRSHLTAVIADTKLGLPSIGQRIDQAISFRIHHPINTYELSTPKALEGLWMTQVPIKLGHVALNIGHIQQNPAVYSTSTSIGVHHPIFRDGMGGSIEHRTQITSDKNILNETVVGGYLQHNTRIIHLSFSHNSNQYQPKWGLQISIRNHKVGKNDADKDGVPDTIDACVNTPEDIDGYHDQDGCPEANLTLINNPAGSTIEIERAADTIPFRSAGFSSLKNSQSSFNLMVSDDVIKERIADPKIDIPTMGSLKLIALDEKDQEIPHSIWTIDQQNDMPHRSTGIVVPMKQGSHRIVVKAEGYRPTVETITIADESVHIIHMKLKEHTVSKDLSLPEKLYFATNSHEIDKKSHELLNEVTEILNHHSQIAVVHIEGHTDNQGDATANLRLSQARADEVRQYLLEKGIAPERLVAIGYGSTNPIDTNDTKEGRHANRRVIFTIQEYHVQKE